MVTNVSKMTHPTLLTYNNKMIKQIIIKIECTICIIRIDKVTNI
jgi:hypothetical protein